jgi:hypothetical protein
VWWDKSGGGEVTERARRGRRHQLERLVVFYIYGRLVTGSSDAWRHMVLLEGWTDVWMT